jgi:hypothetical protein
MQVGRGSAPLSTYQATNILERTIHQQLVAQNLQTVLFRCTHHSLPLEQTSTDKSSKDSQVPFKFKNKRPGKSRQKTVGGAKTAAGAAK